MHSLKTGDKVILYIGSDSYDETVEKVSKAGVVTVAGKRFKFMFEHDGRANFRGYSTDRHYIVVDNQDGKLEAHLDPSF